MIHQWHKWQISGWTTVPKALWWVFTVKTAAQVDPVQHPRVRPNCPVRIDSDEIKHQSFSSSHDGRHHGWPHRRQKSHIICLTEFPHNKRRTERVWNIQKAVEEIMLSFSVNDLCTVLSIMNHNGHFCVTMVWLLLCLTVLGWKNREIGSLEWWLSWNEIPRHETKCSCVFLCAELWGYQELEAIQEKRKINSSYKDQRLLSWRGRAAQTRCTNQQGCWN